MVRRLTAREELDEVAVCANVSGLWLEIYLRATMMIRACRS